MKSAKCCDFGVPAILAIDKVIASKVAIDWARSNGYNGKIKDIEVTEVTP